MVGSAELEEQEIEKEKENGSGDSVTAGGELAAEVLCFSLEEGSGKALRHLNSTFREVFGPSGQFSHRVGAVAFSPSTDISGNVRQPACLPLAVLLLPLPPACSFPSPPHSQPCYQRYSS